jgi:hypothetical protein
VYRRSSVKIYKYPTFGGFSLKTAVLRLHPAAQAVPQVVRLLRSHRMQMYVLTEARSAYSITFTISLLLFVSLSTILSLADDLALSLRSSVLGSAMLRQSHDPGGETRIRPYSCPVQSSKRPGRTLFGLERYTLRVKHIGPRYHFRFPFFWRIYFLCEGSAKSLR